MTTFPRGRSVQLSLLVVSILSLIIMAKSAEEATVHIIYTEKPIGEEPKAYHLRTLTTVLGSKEAANDALIYSYKNAATGFSAKLTPTQVAEISKQPGVLRVVASTNYRLHQPGGFNGFKL